MGSTSADDLIREVARDLTALGDSGLIMAGLVLRVRAATGCDLAYVSLNDAATHHTAIRFADGIRTAEYAAISMPIGTGVLGMAAAGVTTESSDYLRDVAKLHIDTVDTAVRKEGVAAILSTPLRSGNEVVGALTIANRRAGPFNDDHRAILDAGALIGSVAVEVYTLRETVAAHRRRSQDETAELALTRELSSALRAGGGSEDVLSIASRAVEGTVRLGDVGDLETQPSVLRLELDGGGVAEIEADPARIRPLTGVITTFLSISLLYEGAIDDARHLRESELIERLIDPPDEIGRTLRSGLPGDGALAVTVIKVHDPNYRRSAAGAIRRATGRRALVTDHRGAIVVVARSAGRELDRLGEILSGTRFVAGRSTAETEEDIPAAFHDAELVAEAMRALGREGEAGTRQQLGVVAFALGTDSTSAELLIDSYLAPLLGGAERNDRLLLTALVYLDNQASVTMTAKHLAVHENTVRQRLERLDTALPGWRKSPSVLDTHVALRTWALIGSSAPRRTRGQLGS